MFRPMGEVVRSTRDVPPLSYIVNIEPFSLLSKLLEESGKEKYESNEFEAGGHKWKMIIYPNGDNKSDVRDYISVYVEMTDATPSPDVNVMLKFFLLNQINKKYTTFEDNKLRSFNAITNVRGISRMLSLDAFRDSSSGYITDDCCTFGTEIVVVEPERNGEKLTITKEPRNSTFSWKLANFSTLEDERYHSDEFSIGGLKWKLWLYPTGTWEGKGKYVSIFLYAQDNSNLRVGWKVYATFVLSIKDQFHDKHEENTVKHTFCALSNNWGFSKFISLTDLEDEKRCFLVNDTVIIEAKITFMSLQNCFA